MWRKVGTCVGFDLFCVKSAPTKAKSGHKSKEKEAVTMAFLGSSSYSLDSKNRVFIPAKYREELGNVFYITRSLEACLTIYTEDEWAAFLQKLERLPSTTGAAVKEYFLSAAQKCQTDSSGRIILDDTLIKHSKIKKNVMFVGAGQLINVWSEEGWIDREDNRDVVGMGAFMSQHGL